jgi:hypothetical protein
MTAVLSTREAEASLRAFIHESGANGERMADLAGHAAMPSVLRPELVHLLRINYFLDPPQDLPFEAEASLLLSRLCTEIDDGVFVIDPTLRDLLLRQLIGRHGQPRIRDIARLLWEYNGRGTPWGNRPGLLEAQQLTALNFIDPPRALAWLERARRGEGAVPVSGERWFVALRQDLLARTAAISPEASTLMDSLPALRELWNDLVATGADQDAAVGVAAALGIPLPEFKPREAPDHAWRLLLEAAWNASRIPELLEAISAQLGRAKSWTDAVHEFWIRLSPALPVDSGTFAAPPPEWAVLESHRVALENAIGATVLLVIEGPTQEPRVFGLGTLVGKTGVVITHSSIVADALSSGFGPNAPARVFAELVDDHPSLGYVQGLQRRLELVQVAVDQPTQLVALTAGSVQPPDGWPESLPVITEALPFLKGRKVCVVGYPMEDPRIDSQVVSRALVNAYGVLRLMPGEILDEDTSRGVLVHNCFTTVGTGGAALIDVETGIVLGVHFAAKYDPTSLGLKQGQAISMLPFVTDTQFVQMGVFESPGPQPIQQPIRRFSNVALAEAMSTSLPLLDVPGQLLLVQGPKKSGKSALLLQLQQAAQERGLRCWLFSATRAESRAFIPELAQRASVNPYAPFDGEPVGDWIRRQDVLHKQLRAQPTVLLLDKFDPSQASTLEGALAELAGDLRAIVIAGVDVESLAHPTNFWATTVIDLKPAEEKPKPGVLVVGTGSYDLPKPVELAAQAIGEAIARAGCILVTGGWPGVDHVAARAFSAALGNDTSRLPGDLIQVVEGDQRLDFPGESTIVRVDHNDRSSEALKYADVIVLIGGAGGTWDAFRTAVAAGKPVIPLFNTGTDARRAAILLGLFAGSNAASPFMGADFDTEYEAHQTGSLLATIFADLARYPLQLQADPKLLWMTDTILPLASRYLRRSAGYDEDANRIFQEFSAREFSASELERLLEAFLEDPDPAWRCTAYLAIEVKAPASSVLPVLNSGAKERALALDQRETRPLWRWLCAVRRLLDRYSGGTLSDLIGILHGTARELQARTDVDPGGECKRAIDEILHYLQPTSPPDADLSSWSPTPQQAPGTTAHSEDEPAASSSLLTEAWALSGTIEKPFAHIIQPNTHSAVRRSGGYETQNAHGFRIEGILSADELSSQSSIATPRMGSETRLATVSIKGLRIAEILAADRVVAQVSVASRPVWAHSVTFLGTQFENLRIFGDPVGVYLDLSIADRYFVGDVEDASTSLVTTITAPSSNSKILDNRIVIPDFGIISFADLILESDRLQLTMIQCHFSGPLSGSLQVANCHVTFPDSDDYEEEESPHTFVA